MSSKVADSAHKHQLLTRDFFARKTDTVARDLLGKLLVHETKAGVISAKIVETEAYFGDGADPASHAHKGPTPRSSIMFGKCGVVYVYFNYGVHWLLNFVAKVDGQAGAVLIRAVQPVQGTELMLKNRPTAVANLTNGPGKLTKAFGIDGSFNGFDVTIKQSNFYIVSFLTPQFEIIADTRIGIKKGQEKLLRFYIKDNAFISNVRRKM